MRVASLALWPLVAHVQWEAVQFIVVGGGHGWWGCQRCGQNAQKVSDAAAFAMVGFGFLMIVVASGVGGEGHEGLGARFAWVWRQFCL